MAAACSVSVLVPAYNSASTLARAVRSVLQQDLADLEVVIIDDGSSDATGDIARTLCGEDPRVRLITQPRNRGKACAMNLAIGQARGQWLAVLDADDWYAADRLSTMLAVGRAQDVELVADNQFLYDAGAARVVRTAFSGDTGSRILDKAGFIAGSDPYADFDYGMLKPIVRADFVRAHALAYRENARLSEDFLYLLEFFAAGGRAVVLARPTYYWSQAFGTISRQWTETGSGSWRYDYLSAIRANAEVLEAMRGRGDSALAGLLRRRMRAFQQLYWIQRLSRLRAERASAFHIARELMSHPTVWPLVVRRGIRRAVKIRPLQSPMRV